MILHVIDADGNNLYVTDLNAIDAATGQPRVVFVDPNAGKTYVHLYSDFFKVIRVTSEDGEEMEIPQYQVQGMVESIPNLGNQTAGHDAGKKSNRKRRIDRMGAHSEDSLELARPVVTAIPESDSDAEAPL